MTSSNDNAEVEKLGRFKDILNTKFKGEKFTKRGAALSKDFDGSTTFDDVQLVYEDLEGEELSTKSLKSLSTLVTWNQAEDPTIIVNAFRVTFKKVFPPGKQHDGNSKDNADEGEDERFTPRAKKQKTEEATKASSERIVPSQSGQSRHRKSLDAEIHKLHLPLFPAYKKIADEFIKQINAAQPQQKDKKNPFIRTINDVADDLLPHNWVQEKVDMENDDLLFSGIVVRALDRLVYPNGTEGSILHQVSSTKNMSSSHSLRPDLIAFHQTVGQYLPAIPVAMGEGKTSTGGDEYYQAYNYTARTMRAHWVTPVGKPTASIAFNKHYLTLRVYFPTANKNFEITVARARANNYLDVEAFVQATADTFKQLCTDRAAYPFQRPPWLPNTVTRFQHLSTKEEMARTTVRSLDGPFVYTVLHNLITPTNTLLNTIGRDAALDGHILKYKYLDVEPGIEITVAMVKAVVTQLQQLHCLKLVHGDVQSRNILWHPTESTLIDWEFLGIDSEATYPEDYTLDEDLQNCTMQCTHDWEKFIAMLDTATNPGKEMRSVKECINVAMQGGTPSWPNDTGIVQRQVVRQLFST
eukprot:TRINITY_DN67886_c1_g6_i1.p1 TRINITY_DN67886_c1_g6~~TRINITY_DN67886_c1_g6_i1.p1  ORF type:complete len:582 (+),score=41.72 TRINITY_DN67886_c1_g6_i1:39-1784(+)